MFWMNLSVLLLKRVTSGDLTCMQSLGPTQFCITLGTDQLSLVYKPERWSWGIQHLTWEKELGKSESEEGYVEKLCDPNHSKCVRLPQRQISWGPEQCGAIARPCLMCWLLVFIKHPGFSAVLTSLAFPQHSKTEYRLWFLDGTEREFSLLP